ncbi:hypothetical protein CRG98_000421 [Punica granatum]|uniref:Cytochrome P450 724B1-like n=1 Tax=Punica granatum TaxID=22663 RepID=A0A2I0LEN1_PUNGR|nr:hypothetical protein CRG98_000421 [Punica granatum]
MHGILGKHSLLLVSGEQHKKLRNVAVSFISASKATADFHRCLEELCTAMMESWKGRKEVSFHKEAKEFTMSLMVKTLLSIKPGDVIGSRILEDFLTYMKGFVSLPLYFPGSPYAMAVKARARLSSTVKEIMKERKNKCISSSGDDQNRISDDHSEGVGDFLDVIMGKEGSRWGLSDEEQVSIVLDILLGGYETTATLMSLLVYFLAQYPIALQTLKEEHQAIRRSKQDGEPLNWEDYNQMQFTYNVICETLRYGNVVKFVHRKAIRDIEYKGTHKKVTPFGGGARLCPGYGLAQVELAFFLHHLVLNYRWKIKGDEMPLAYPYVEFKRGLLLKIEPINNSIN